MHDNNNLDRVEILHEIITSQNGRRIPLQNRASQLEYGMEDYGGPGSHINYKSTRLMHIAGGPSVNTVIGFGTKSSKSNKDLSRHGLAGRNAIIMNS